MHLERKLQKDSSRMKNTRLRHAEYYGMTETFKKFVCQSHITEKARKRIKDQLKNQINAIQRAPNGTELIKQLQIYNSMVIGIHNYYQIATQVNASLMPIQYQLTQVERHRFKYLSLKKHSKGYRITDKGIRPYLKSEMTRYINDYPIIPIGFIRTRTALMPKWCL
ncbi:hypothetical protein [Lysinibacillus sp. NPDC086135]|uniref:hypothetical protein n=1 Tax=Lysinibacillus sp. NPDC086135 TaxID=3364130 RepID=UPI0038245EA4